MTNCKYYDLINKPIVTEKTTCLGEQNKFVFAIDDSADKKSVKNAIEAIFEVKVKKVNILNIKGKNKRFKGVKGKQSDVKKAIVTLEKDYKIDLSGGIK